MAPVTEGIATESLAAMSRTQTSRPSAAMAWIARPWLDGLVPRP